MVSAQDVLICFTPILYRKAPDQHIFVPDSINLKRLNNMQIRQFELSDKDNLVAFWKQIFPEEPAHNEPSAVIEEKLALDGRIYLAEEEGQIVGSCMAGYDGHRGWLYSVAVDPELRRQGTGRALVFHAIQELAAIGCSKVNLQIRADNAEVAAFYRSLGFAVEDRVSMGLRIQGSQSLA